MENNEINKAGYRYTLTDIYNILYSIDTGSLKKISRGETDEIGDEIISRISEVKKIATKLGWDESAISKGIDAVLHNKEKNSVD